MTMPPAAALPRWLAGTTGSVLIAILVWTLAPLAPPLEDPLPRLALAGLVVLGGAIANHALDRRALGRDGRLVRGAAGDAAQEEEAAVGARLAAALLALRRASGSRFFLYEQPWYVIIGPPGAGKTTALLNAGLDFPLAGAAGERPLAGVGGTRLCDWWFTADAVLIDTAGRYTLQDSDAAVDRAGWQAFLALLCRTRPRRPLNGVIVAIGLPDLLAAGDAERRAHAEAVGARIGEIETRLAMRLPVYLIFTKADLIGGFSEFFANLDADGRRQVWGATFPLDDPAPPATRFRAEFDRLLAALDRRMLDRLGHEPTLERRAAIAAFPAQVARLAPALGQFVETAFGTRTGLPRGFFFASGTQTGTPFDRLAGAMAQRFGVPRPTLPRLTPEHGRSYFLAALLSDIVFGEAMLASEPPSARRRRRLLFAAAVSAIAVLAAAGTGAILAERAIAVRQVDAVAAALSAYEATARGLALDPIADSDLPTLLPLLDRARALAGAVPAAGALLSQSAKLRQGAEATYRHALLYALLPRLLWRLETEMRGNMDRADFLYEATRIYLMLGGAGPLDGPMVEAWMRLDWQQALPGAFNAKLRRALGTHLAALLAEPLPPAPLDGALIADAREKFGRVSFAERVYSRIRPSAEAARLVPWRPGDVLGPVGLGVFARASGKPMSDGVPGFFTPAGFRDVLLPALPAAAAEVAAESWVLGTTSRLDLGPDAMRGLERAVVALYETEYRAAWDAMLADLQIAPLRSLTEAAQNLYILASPQGPVKSLLASLAGELALVPDSAATEAGASVEAKGRAEFTRLQAVLGGPSSEPADAPGAGIDRTYARLRELVARDNGAAIDRMLASLGSLQQLMAKMAAAPLGSSAAVTGADPAAGVRADAQAAPPPLAGWLLAAADQSILLRQGGTHSSVASAYNSPDGPAALCPVAVNGRFPFTGAGSLEISLADFARLFAPGGLLDGFLNTELAPYLDATGAGAWTPHAAAGIAAPIGAEDAARFQRAALIRDLFFAGGGATPRLKFDLTPVAADPGAASVRFEVDANAVAWQPGAGQHATELAWPGPTGSQSVRLVFDPAPAGGTGVLAENGPWALFRMLAHGTLAPVPGEQGRYTLAIRLGEREARFTIDAGTHPSVFDPGILAGFACPVVQ